MRTLIIPCAGKSSRFTTKLPKWLLEHPSGNLMVFESLLGLPLDTFDRIIIVALKRHLTEELKDLEGYKDHHPEDKHDPNALELFCDANPDEPECLVYDD